MAAHQFKDSEGRTWDIVTDLGAARRLRRAGHDIIDFESAGEKIPTFYVDEIDMGEALYAICQPQAMDNAVSEDEFLSSIDGDVTESAREALMAALPDFFSGRKRDIVSGLIARLGPQLEAQANQVMSSLGSLGSESTSTSDASGSTASD